MYVVADLSVKTAQDHIDNAAHASAREFLRVALETSLVLPFTKASSREFREYLSSLSPTLQSAWIELLKNCMLKVGVTRGRCGCPRVLNTAVDVHILADDDEEDTCQQCNTPSVRWPNYAYSQLLTQIQRERVTSIAPGTTRGDVFQSRLQSLLLGASEVTVVDRYAAIRAVRGSMNSGLRHWLELTWSLAPIDVVLYAGLGTGNSAITKAAIEREARSIVRQLAAANRGKLEIRLCPDAVFAQNSHDRFVTTTVSGRTLAVSLGKGIEVFEEPTIQQPYSSQLIVNDPSIAIILQNLQRGTSSTAVVP